MPMDETLVSAAVDFGGRAAFVYRADALKGRWIGDFDAELAREFFGGFVGRRAVQPAPRGPLRRERAPHDRGAVQGVRARDVARRRGSTRAWSACRRPRGRSPRERDRRRVVVADLGSGNLRSVEKALAAVGADVTVSADADVGRARRQAGRARPGRVRRLRGRARPRRRRAARRRCAASIAAGRPYFGICLGMQVLFERSEENPEAPRPGHPARARAAASPIARA